METAAPDHGTTPELPPPEEQGLPAAATQPTEPIEKPPALPSRPNMAARHAKRLTLNFPVAPPLNLRPEQLSSPSVAAATTTTTTPATESPRVMSPGQSIPDALTPGEELSDPTDLLTAIASQERKVLELREELQRAEVELAGLKKQWVLSERQKKHTEISHRAEAMRPLRPITDGPSDESPNASDTASPAGTATPTDTVSTHIRRSKELERRSSIRNVPKSDVSVSANGRRVFAGSKHTRTLSLLSPDMGIVRPPFPIKTDSEQTGGTEAQATRHPRSATLPSVERVDSSKSSEKPNDSVQDASGNQWRRSLPPPSSEALLRTGRQMASDLREGLWTFLEDIRQATVGEEAISATRTRTLQPPASGTTPRSRSGQRAERSVTPVRRQSQQNGELGRTNSSSSLSQQKESAAKKNGNKNFSSPADKEVSFWSEFGVDTPGQKLETNQSAANIRDGQKESETRLNAEEDDWSNWDTPQPLRKSHTPSSSQSTLTSKHDQSPSTQLSSPRTSFGDRNTDDGGRRRTDSSSIPWPALSKFTASQLTRTASSLMDEWEKSLTSASSSSSSPSLSSSTSKKADPSKTARHQKEQDEWEAF